MTELSNLFRQATGFCFFFILKVIITKVAQMTPQARHLVNALITMTVDIYVPESLKACYLCNHRKLGRIICVFILSRIPR